MNKKEFGALIQTIRGCYGERFQTLDTVMADAWYEFLNDLDFARAKVALGNYIKSNAYPPTIADIRAEYQKILDAESEARVQLRGVYEETVAIYPMANHEPDIERTYKAILNGIEKKDRMKAACRILDRAKRHVRACEESGSSTIEPLTEFVKGIDLDELLN